MEQVLYGDVLFFVNFTMDFLTLFVTGKILHRGMKTGALLLSASIGAVYGVAAIFITGSRIISIAVNLAVSFLMCYIVFRKKLLVCTALFYGNGCLLGGVMTALYYLVSRSFGNRLVYVNGSYETLSGNIPFGWMAVTAIIIGLAAVAGGRLCKKRRNMPAVIVTAEYRGKKIVFDGICDSGNLLTDPIGGAPVIITQRETLERIIPDEYRVYFEADGIRHMQDASLALMRNIRLIPAGSVMGGGVLVGLIPSKVTVDGVERSACIAVGRDAGSSAETAYGGCAAVVPAVLCGN